MVVDGRVSPAGGGYGPDNYLAGGVAWLFWQTRPYGGIDGGGWAGLAGGQWFLA